MLLSHITSSADIYKQTEVMGVCMHMQWLRCSCVNVVLVSVRPFNLINSVVVPVDTIEAGETHFEDCPNYNWLNKEEISLKLITKQLTR